MPSKADKNAPLLARVIRELPPSTPFVAPESLERHKRVPLQLRLGANESAFGASPLATTAMQDAAAHVHWYGDPECHELRTALSKVHGVDYESIIVGNGIDGLLGYCVRALVDPGEWVVTTLGTYPTFNYHVLAFGGRLFQVPPYRDGRPDLQGLLDAARRHDVRIVYLANPDNPSGGWQHDSDLAHLIRILPKRCVLLLDEAYSEFAPADTVVPAAAPERNVIRLRTFSKAYGMAGARIGYAISCREIIAAMNKFRNQFEVSRLSQAGALAALKDAKHVQGVIAQVEEGRRDYETLARELGLQTIPSITNFVCIDMGSAERAGVVLTQLLRRGVFVRVPSAPPLDRCIRVTVGTTEERGLFAEVFRDILKSL